MNERLEIQNDIKEHGSMFDTLQYKLDIKETKQSSNEYTMVNTDQGLKPYLLVVVVYVLSVLGPSSFENS